MKLLKSKFHSVIDYLFIHKRTISVVKLAVLSLLMLFSLRTVWLVNVELALAIVFVLTEFDFDGFYFSFFLVNFRFVFRNMTIGNIPYVYIIFFIYAIYAFIKYFVVKKEKIKINWWLIGVSIFFLIYIALPVYNFYFSEYIKFVFMISAINVILMFKDKINVRKLILYFTYGCLVASFIFLVTQVWFNNFFIEMNLDVSAHGNKRYRGLSGDPNYYSVDLMISISALYYLYITKNIRQLHYVLLSFVLFNFAWLTYSKSMFIAMVFFLVMVILFTLCKDLKGQWKKTIVVIFLALISLLNTNYVLGKDTLSVVSRFEDGFSHETSTSQSSNLEINRSKSNFIDVDFDTNMIKVKNDLGFNGDNTDTSDKDSKLDGITTGRWTLWKNHLKFLFSSPKNFFFGGGIGTFVEPMECHNTFIQVLYEVGFIGTIIFLMIVILCLKELNFNLKLFNPKNWYKWIVLLVTLLLFFNVNYFGSTSFIFHVTIGVLILLKEVSVNANKTIQCNSIEDKKEISIREKDLISIIVPVYKVENFLPRCIDSLMAQSYKKIEIILVDDGSPDGSPQICDEYAKRDDRIKVIHKKNGGLSDARNVGLDSSKGKYISFVDSDDYVNEDFIKTMYKNLIRNNADISICGFRSFSDGEEVLNDYVNTTEVLNKEQLINCLFAKNSVSFITACNKLYKRIIFDDLRFDVGKINEDSFIVHKIFNKCEKSVITTADLYYYYQRQNSITKSSNYTDKNLDSIYSIIDRYEFFKGTNFEEKSLISLCRGIAYNYCIAKSRKAKREIVDKIIKIYKEYYNRLKSKDFQLLLFRYFPNLCYLIKSLTVKNF